MQDKQLTRHNVPHNTVPYASQPTSNKQCTRNKIAPTLATPEWKSDQRPSAQELQPSNNRYLNYSDGADAKIPFQDIWSNYDRSKNILPSHLSTTSGYLYYPESRNGKLPLQDKRKNQYSSSSKARTELLTSITDIRAIPNISAARILHCQGTWTSYISIYGPKIPTHQWQSCGQTTCTIQLSPQ
jgi:hypothetical protein